MHKKFGIDRVCGSGNILSGRQIHRQTHSSQYFATAVAALKMVAYAPDKDGIGINDDVTAGSIINNLVNQKHLMVKEQLAKAMNVPSHWQIQTVSVSASWLKSLVSKSIGTRS